MGKFTKRINDFFRSSRDVPIQQVLKDAKLGRIEPGADEFVPPSKDLLPASVREQSHEFRNEIHRLTHITRQFARDLDTTNERLAKYSKAMGDPDRKAKK